MALEVNGKIITDSQQMADLWANYFEKLATPEENENYDRFHRTEIENEINNIIQKSGDTLGHIFTAPLTIEEISEVVRSLPDGEAHGFDGITYEHLKYGGDMIIHALLNIYTCIIDRKEIPNSFKLAVKILIPKGNKKGKMFDDHRGISLLFCINKVLERIVLSRLQRQQNCQHHPLQEDLIVDYTITKTTKLSASSTPEDLIVNEFFSTVPGKDFDLCIIPTRTKTHKPFRKMDIKTPRCSHDIFCN